MRIQQGHKSDELYHINGYREKYKYWRRLVFLKKKVKPRVWFSDILNKAYVFLNQQMGGKSSPDKNSYEPSLSNKSNQKVTKMNYQRTPRRSFWGRLFPLALAWQPAGTPSPYLWMSSSSGSGQKPVIRVGRRRKAEPPASGRERAETPQREREQESSVPASYGGTGGEAAGRQPPGAPVSQ